MSTETILNVGATTTDQSEQPPKEWWDIEVSTIWAEESLKRSWTYFERLESQWRALMKLLRDGDEFRRFAAPGTERFGMASGFVIVRSGQAVAALALPTPTVVDSITGDLAKKTWLGEPVDTNVVPKELRLDRVALNEINNTLLKQWQAMLSLMQPGDEIRRYDNGGWAVLCGRCGYALVRKGEVIASFKTLMN